MQKLVSFILFVVLIASAFAIITSSPASFAQDRPARCNECVKLNTAPDPVSYIHTANYEPNYQPF